MLLNALLRAIGLQHQYQSIGAEIARVGRLVLPFPFPGYGPDAPDQLIRGKRLAEIRYDASLQYSRLNTLIRIRGDDDGRDRGAGRNQTPVEVEP